MSTPQKKEPLSVLFNTVHAPRKIQDCARSKYVILVNHDALIFFSSSISHQIVHTCEANDAFLLHLTLSDVTSIQVHHMLACSDTLVLNSFISSTLNIVSSTKNVESTVPRSSGFTRMVLV
jgi:hypothetical protein